MSERVGIVVIGRNEGERLVRCLESVRGQGQVVYVDSGSTDGSVGRARELGAEVVELDMSKPFTAARARNAGFARLREHMPDVEFVQFVDGDCEVEPGWLHAGTTALQLEPGLAAVCGRLRERFPEASIFNQLCQMEWDGPLGDVASCGGVAMYRVKPFADANGFRESMQAGEEPELCFRLRSAGANIRRVAQQMAIHDAAMTKTVQWMTRTKRGGQAFAECHWLHRGSGFRRREVSRAIVWGIIAPSGIAVGLLGIVVSPWLAVIAILSVLGMCAMSVRASNSKRRQGYSLQASLLYGIACLTGKPFESLGLLRYHLNRARGQHIELLEYRRSEPQGKIV